MKKLIITTFLTVFTLINISAQWLDTQTIQSTVLLEKITPEGFLTHGTGFLMYNYEDQTKIIVITCKHLILNKNQISVRFNPDSSILPHLSIENQVTLLNNVILTKNSIRIVVDLTEHNTFFHPKLVSRQYIYET